MENENLNENKIEDSASEQPSQAAVNTPEQPAPTEQPAKEPNAAPEQAAPTEQPAGPAWKLPMDSRKLERVLLVLICCLAVLLSVLILAPGLRARAAREAERERLAAEEAARQAEQERLAALPQPGLSLEQGWGTLRVTVLGEDGQPLTLPELALELQCADGSWFTLSAQEGRLELSGLPAGDYSLRLLAGTEHRGTEPLRFTLEGASPDMASQDRLLLDDEGRPVYHYRAALGPNGCLLDRAAHGESDLLPLDMDGDGSLDCALRLIRDESGRTVLLSGRVPLVNEDGSPVEDYCVYAEPVLALSSGGWERTDRGMVYTSPWGGRLTGLQRIEGKYYLFDEDGICARSLGVDVSYFNEDIDWEMVKAQGVDFAIVRIGGRGWSSGAPYDDLRAIGYLQGAHKAGLKTGVYFYTTAINEREAAEEAQIAVKKLRGLHLDMPIFIDMEYSGEYPRGRSDRLSAAERTEIIRTFCKTVEASGYQAGVYSGQFFYQYALNYPAIARYTVWMANYTYGEYLPRFAHRYDIWQFSDWGSLAGVHGHCDLNAIL